MKITSSAWALLSLALVTSLALSGCASTVKVPLVLPSSIASPTPEVPEAPKTVDISRELLRPCSDLAVLPSANPSAVDVLRQKALDVVNYKECRGKHEALVEIVRKAFNILR